jgi:CubicO group peptidase (beta-lactamase class C family)
MANGDTIRQIPKKLDLINKEKFMAISQPFPRSTPEAQGIRSSDLLEFVNRLEAIPSPNSLMLLRHGKVVAEGWWHPYRPDVPHMLFSLTKSFTSTAVGLVIAEGKLSLDETIVSIFADDAPANPSENLKAMRIWHLLTMTTGHHKDATQRTLSRRDRNTARAFLSIPVKHPPGTHFVYNSAASHILSTIVQKRTGQTLRQYLTPRLFEPLGIEVVEWESYPDGVNFGGWGMSLKTEDIAKFGQLYLQDGLWQGQRLLPEGWVKTATSKQVENGNEPNNDWSQGYGFQFWRTRKNTYRGDGAFGQFCFVFPEQDAVLAMTSGVGDMQAVMNQVHDVLIPALGSEVLPEDLPGQRELAHRLASLRLSPLTGKPTPDQIGKRAGGRYLFEKNPAGLKWAHLELGESSWKVALKDRWGRHDLAGGYTDWDEVDGGMEKAAVSAGWRSQDELAIQVCRYTTPFIVTYHFQFDHDRVLCKANENVSFDKKTDQVIVGKLEKG